MDQTPDFKFWLDFLNKRADELGLEKNVKMVKPRDEMIGAVTWAYEQDGGELVDLGWSVEQAETSLRDIAGAA